MSPIDIACTTLFWISAFVIFWANIGYPLFIILLGKIIHRQNPKTSRPDTDTWPTVTVLTPVHNEEKVIRQKIQNLLDLDYPSDKITFLFSSDFSDDNTNDIISASAQDHPNIRLHITKRRAGKTNAQNEAMRLVSSEFTVFTDANSILKKNAVKELIRSFSQKDIAYVCGRLCYANSNHSSASASETTYWDMETRIRSIESRIQTITAGNGALYACRTQDYHVFKPHQGHDFYMPRYFSLQGKRAIANDEAIAFEKASEKMADEFPRKIRMFQNCVKQIFPPLSILNFPKTRWYPVFYFGHRSCRYSLWVAHLLLLVTNIVLPWSNLFYLLPLIVQVIFYVFAALGALVHNGIFKLCSYYAMTILAQMVAAFKDIFHTNKPFWEKAESTR